MVSKIDEKNILLKTVGLKKHFFVKKSYFISQIKILKAVDGVNISVCNGETVGLVGESGCGKSTLGRTILMLHPVTDGSICFKGKCIEKASLKSIREMRKNMQMIFQDPFSSLNPRMTIMESVRAPMDVFHIGTKQERKEKVESLLEYVGIGKDHTYKYPHEMSGGQRQRVAIARAMILNPEFIVCDEPVSALDVSVRSQVLNLMKNMQQDHQLAYLFISHDLSVIRYLCDKVAVMYLGQIVEIATKKELYNHPAHPYTKALLSAIPIPDVNVKTERIILEGDIPSPLDMPCGCRFHTRCPYATEECTETTPVLKKLSDEHQVACLMEGGM